MLEINIYDMLVFEDESGSIYQDCVCMVSNHQHIIECNEFYIYQDSLNMRISNDKYKERQFKLKEIWTRTDEDTYKKAWKNKYMSYCIEKRIECNNANSLISSKPSWCDRPESCAECEKAAYCADDSYNHKKPFEVREDGIYKSRPDLGKDLYELVIPKETFVEAFEKYYIGPEQEKTLEPITNNYCSMCEFNDGLVYTSMPPKYKCTKTGEWHEGNHKCDVTESSFVEKEDDKEALKLEAERMKSAVCTGVITIPKDLKSSEINRMFGRSCEICGEGTDSPSNFLCSECIRKLRKILVQYDEEVNND